MTLGNPFDLAPVLGFAGLLCAIAFMSAFAAAEFGTSALFAVAAISAIADIDAIVLSTSRLAAEGLPGHDAMAAILIAAGVNAAMRSAYGLVVGGRAFAIAHGSVTLAAIAAGALVFAQVS
jgi:uncharacterized membrane protein (DUF4010 family)